MLPTAPTHAPLYFYQIRDFFIRSAPIRSTLFYQIRIVTKYVGGAYVHTYIQWIQISLLVLIVVLVELVLSRKVVSLLSIITLEHECIATRIPQTAFQCKLRTIIT
jgi:hypothetical protein